MVKETRTDQQLLEEKWRMIPYFLKLRGLVKNQTDSFNFFLDTDIKNIVMANRDVRTDEDPNFFLDYLDVHVGMPSVKENYGLSPITPMECRLRDLTYAAPVYVDIQYSYNKQVKILQNQLLCYVPIMLRSNYCILAGKTDEELSNLRECPLDPGGYFIVKGTEKVVLIQEQLSKNRIIIEQGSKGEIQGTVTSSTHERKSKTDIVQKHGKFYLHHSTLSEDIPIVIAMKALGVASDMDIMAMIGTESIFTIAMVHSFEEASKLKINTALQALTFIGQRIKMMRTNSFRTRADEARQLLLSVVFPHIPSPDYHFRAKAEFIGSVVRKIIIANEDSSTVDDKDYYGNKRLELAGQLMSLLFEDHFKRFNDDLKRLVEMNAKKRNKNFIFDVSKSFRPDTITNGFVYALSTGNWTLRRFHMDRQGVTQVLSRLSYISALGMMTRLTSQFEKSRKVSGPRSLQPSQFGMICPSDTPEGESCGLVKNFALLTHVTTDTDPTPLVRLLYSLGVECMDIMAPYETHSYTHILCNGVDLGIHRRPAVLVRDLRKLRRAGRVGEFVSICLDIEKSVVTISSDGGRVCRPLIIVNKGQPALLAIHMKELLDGRRVFADCLKEGMIEYVDVNEENNCLIALSPKLITPQTTHMEIDTLSILGVCAGLIPYPHHNQSPRNTYQCAMGKQAMGPIAFNQHKRIDTLQYNIVSPERPLVKTHTIDMIGFNNLPAGMNAVVAVCSYSGYDIEDAIILNKASLDRGFARCVVYRKALTSFRTYPNSTVDTLFGPPNPTIPQVHVPGQLCNEAKIVDRDDTPVKRDRYSNLDRDGIACQGERLQNGDVWCNKYVPTQTTITLENPDLTKYNANPHSYRGPVPVVVDQVIVTANDDSNLHIKASLRQLRRPEPGDKFSSRHGQKGVCGLIVEQVDMPFSDQGISPDLIMNPHGYPSRMTVGKLMELVSGKGAVLEGKFHDATAFAGDKIEDFCRVLVSRGFSYSGKDMMMSGITGEPLSAYIFFGPLYYQKLKHMVLDKMHARSRGPRALLTRQPTEGRSRDGGLRLGEMEKDCLLGYGAGNLLIERLMLSSDVFQVTVCGKCGMIGYKNWCQHCRSIEHTSIVRMPYACKLLFQELESMNISARLELESDV